MLTSMGRNNYRVCGPEVRKNWLKKRLILPWIGSCPGLRNGRALICKAIGPGSSPGPG